MSQNEDREDTGDIVTSQPHDFITDNLPEDEEDREVILLRQLLPRSPEDDLDPFFVEDGRETPSPPDTPPPERDFEFEPDQLESDDPRIGFTFRWVHGIPITENLREQAELRRSLGTTHLHVMRNHLIERDAFIDRANVSEDQERRMMLGLSLANIGVDVVNQGISIFRKPIVVSAEQIVRLLGEVRWVAEFFQSSWSHLRLRKLGFVVTGRGIPELNIAPSDGVTHFELNFDTGEAVLPPHATDQVESVISVLAALSIQPMPAFFTMPTSLWRKIARFWFQKIDGQPAGHVIGPDDIPRSVLQTVSTLRFREAYMIYERVAEAVIRDLGSLDEFRLTLADVVLAADAFQFRSSEHVDGHKEIRLDITSTFLAKFGVRVPADRRFLYREEDSNGFSGIAAILNSSDYVHLRELLLGMHPVWYKSDGFARMSLDEFQKLFNIEYGEINEEQRIIQYAHDVNPRSVTHRRNLARAIGEYDEQNAEESDQRLSRLTSNSPVGQRRGREEEYTPRRVVRRRRAVDHVMPIPQIDRDPDPNLIPNINADLRNRDVPWELEVLAKVLFNARNDYREAEFDTRDVSALIQFIRNARFEVASNGSAELRMEGFGAPEMGFGMTDGVELYKSSTSGSEDVLKIVPYGTKREIMRLMKYMPLRWLGEQSDERRRPIIIRAADRLFVPGAADGIMLGSSALRQLRPYPRVSDITHVAANVSKHRFLQHDAIFGLSAQVVASFFFAVDVRLRIEEREIYISIQTNEHDGQLPLKHGIEYRYFENLNTGGRAVLSIFMSPKERSLMISLFRFTAPAILGLPRALTDRQLTTLFQTPDEDYEEYKDTAFVAGYGDTSGKTQSVLEEFNSQLESLDGQNDHDDTDSVSSSDPMQVEPADE